MNTKKCTIILTPLVICLFANHVLRANNVVPSAIPPANSLALCTKHSNIGELSYWSCEYSDSYLQYRTKMSPSSHSPILSKLRHQS